MTENEAQKASRALASWYKQSARSLPWRVSPEDWASGIRPDPYHVWVSEMMLQQTTVPTVRDRFTAFLRVFPTVDALARASLDDVLAQWAGLGYYSRARNMHKAAQRFASEGFPKTAAALRDYPGIGAYTAAAIASIAFDTPEVVVDGNVERVVSRLFALSTPMPKVRSEIVEKAALLTPVMDAGQHAQAMMDLASSICRPRNPSCLVCPIRAWCMAAGDSPERFPVKQPKKAKPVRRGMIALGLQGTDWLFERRPEKGLLGGTLGLPGGNWGEEVDVLWPAPASWRLCGQIVHQFTHFRLELDVYAGLVEEGVAVSNRLIKVPRSDFSSSTLPTVMKKAFDLASKDFDGK